MKTKLLTLFLLFSANFLLAQNNTPPQPARRVHFKVLQGDSAVMHFNKKYELIEDSCADIIRMAHYNPKIRKFSGFFKDINANNSAQLISEGNYTEDGLKNGMFTCYFFNGVQQSKGQFTADKPTGHWDIFYESGKPKLSFDNEAGITKIENEWDETGEKVVDNGRGAYVAKVGYFSWKGKLDNGVPDGTWHSFKTDDVTQTAVSEEYFKKGQFVKGSALGTDYTDASRIQLIPDALFPYNEAEKLHVSPINCNGYGHRHIVGARFPGGSTVYSEDMRIALQHVLGKLRINTFGYTMIITGEVGENGILIDLRQDNALENDLSRSIIEALRTLPPLNPATADGKPIRQGFELIIDFTHGQYHFTHHFLPIKQADVQDVK